MKLARLLALALTALTAAACATRFVSSYEDDPNWTPFRSQHFTFFVRPGSPAEHDIDRIIQEQETGIKTIGATLHVSFTGSISYYIYNAEEGDRIGQSNEGFADVANLTIRWRYSGLPMGIHETVHIVADWTVGRAGTAFMTEGLAVAVNDEFGGWPIEQWWVAFGEQGDLVPIRELLEHWGDYEDSVRYPQSGSFVDFLLTRYGADVVKRVFLLLPDEYSAGLQAACGKDLDQVEAEYTAFLREYAAQPALPAAPRVAPVAGAWIRSTPYAGPDGGHPTAALDRRRRGG